MCGKTKRQSSSLPALQVRNNGISASDITCSVPICQTFSIVLLCTNLWTYEGRISSDSFHNILLQHALSLKGRLLSLQNTFTVAFLICVIGQSIWLTYKRANSNYVSIWSLHKPLWLVKATHRLVRCRLYCRVVIQRVNIFKFSNYIILKRIYVFFFFFERGCVIENQP